MSNNVTVYICDECCKAIRSHSEKVTWTIDGVERDLCKKCIVKVIDREMAKVRREGLKRRN